MPSDEQQIDALQARYLDLLHAMQTGVAFMMERDAQSTTPKHLRVGVNSALIESTAIVKLLIAKGVITELEWWTALCEMFAEEVRGYEEKLNGGNPAIKITLR